MVVNLGSKEKKRLTMLIFYEFLSTLWEKKKGHLTGHPRNIIHRHITS